MASSFNPNVSLYDRWHSGERKVQDLLHVREAMQGASSILRPYLTTQMQEFVPGLCYFYIGTLDEQGRPWVSMLTGHEGFMNAPHIRTLEIKTQLESGNPLGGKKSGSLIPDPIFHNLTEGETRPSGSRKWGGVALDFSNRRRNKMNGALDPADILVADGDTGELHVRMTVEQTVGNCPKYITIREFGPRYDASRTHNAVKEKTATIDGEEKQSDSYLSEEARAIIHQADCLFIASRYIDEDLPDQTSGMDCNHRGGNPGFTLVEGNKIVFPDYSGNRFFNTLGNIANDDRTGMLFVNFNTGDLLHVTGRAEIFVGHDAQTKYPHSKRCIQLTIDDHLLRMNALPFSMRTSELSPYNPMVPSSQHGGVAEAPGERISAKLSGITKHTKDISTFHFQTSKPIRYSPGQYAVLDFSEFDTTGYRHMADDDPQSLNDDYIRTWTISSAPLPVKDSKNEWKETSEFTMTIKRKPGGAISNLLHSQVLDDQHPFEVPLVSTGGSFLLPNSPVTPMTIRSEPEGAISDLLHSLVLDDRHPLEVPLVSTGGSLVPPNSSVTHTSPIKVALISGGIGSTPFISMLRGARQMTQGPIDIQWIKSAPYFNDALPEILEEITTTPEETTSEAALTLSINVFLTREKNPNDSSAAVTKQFPTFPNTQFHFQRLGSQAMLAAVPDIRERQVLLCGPEPFMEAVKGFLNELDVPGGNVLVEAFNF
ncbi:hypothetical protein EDD21DRAFT_376744 [Dissophora ornata]|nr:hypothetical protein BGZ58_004540 [Dissophora ornata]KAI8600591.1 hypothetical protein EDD21DRAFT_376744 [Dissophora ornata]